MLKFIGTGSAFNAELGNTSAYIKENGVLFLLDCGETVFSRIKELSLLDDVTSVYVAITHNHSDHVASLPTLIEYLNIYRDIVPNIVLSNDEEINANQEKDLRELLEKFAIGEEDYEFVYGDMLEEVLPELKKVEMKKITHSPKLTSLTVELHFKENTIYYLADQNDKTFTKSVAKKLKPKDLVYTDCTIMDYKNRPHITLEELANIFDEKQRQQVVCMHFDNYKTYNEAKSLGFKTANKEIDKFELLKKLADRK